MEDDRKVEAALFSSGRPVRIGELAKATGIESGRVRSCITRLTKKYSGDATALEIGRAGDKYEMRVKDKYRKPALPLAKTDIPRPVIKTLSLIAYYQPMRQRDLLEMKDKIIEGDTKKRLLSFKDGENHYVMECSDIIYLSSYGRKTIIHTANRDYETSVLLKEIVRKLPSDEFVRIHKRFTVNLRYVSRVQYHEGGRYRVYLEDDDDSTLPVGPTFTSMLKARLQI